MIRFDLNKFNESPKKLVSFRFVMYVTRDFSTTADLLCRYNIIYEHGRVLYSFQSISFVPVFMLSKPIQSKLYNHYKW